MTDQGPSPGTRRPDPLSVLWRVLGLPQTLMALLALLSLALALANTVPQVPYSARADPQAWLVVQSGVPGSLRSLLWALGLFDIYQALWFRLLLAVSGVALVVRLADAAELAWRAVRPGRWAACSSRLCAGGLPSIVLAPTALGEQEQLQRRLRALGYRSSILPGTPVPLLVASRRAWAFWARPIALASILAALAGLFVTATWGWQTQDQQLRPGESLPVGHGLPYVLQLDSFSLNGGSPESQVKWLQQDAELRKDLLRVGRPAHLDGIAARQVGYVPFIRVRGRDETGRPLLLQVEGQAEGLPTETEIVFPSALARPVLDLPRQDAFLVFHFQPSCAAKPATLSAEHVLGTGVPSQALPALSQSGTLRLDGLLLEVDLSYRPILRLDYRPGLPLAIGGLALSLLALLLFWLVSPRLVWLTFRAEDEPAAPVEASDAVPLVHDDALRKLAQALQRETADAA